MMKPYRTLKSAASDEFIVNKSRFLGYAAPCGTEEAALTFLSEIRLKHRDASHNCYAYVIGENAGIMRYSDDGEPGGTAGMPIMEVIKNRQVVNCCVVVTRYFGGVLLGAGGLVRAYTKGCAIALDAAGVVTMQPSARLLVEIGYSLWDKTRHALKGQPVIVESTSFGAAVGATLLVRMDDLKGVSDALVSLTDGKIDLIVGEELMYGWPEEG